VSHHLRLAVLFSAVASACLPTPPASGADLGPDPREVQAVRDKAVAFLRKRQGADGSFSPRVAGPGVTALVVAALLRNGLSADDPMVARALAALTKSVKKDGGIYDRMLANYTTCVALMAFKEANKGGKYDSVIKNAGRFLKRLQHADEKDVRFGGVGYDARSKRPDMSNTQFFVEALLAAGVKKDDPAIQRALKFISRCQNLPGETNDRPFAKKAAPEDRGGLTYTPDPDDNPHATPAGGLRSLGAMTYAGLKSFLYAGVKRSDPRVQSAIKWIRRHYTLEQNPGLGQAGLFYYYHTFAKAMDALGEVQFEDAKGVKHDWRKELFTALQKRQRPDGGFVNKGDKAFGEADPNLATAFALLTLSYTQAAKK
jgi:squalene-hopene/tetraprenyl-beta-curcumene cyclase